MNKVVEQLVQLKYERELEREQQNELLDTSGVMLQKKIEKLTVTCSKLEQDYL